MPITQFQSEVLNLIKKNRNPDSYVAGGVAINRSADTPRYSNDIDFFHDADEAVRLSAEADMNILIKNKFKIQKIIDQTSFIRVVISKGDNDLKLDWARDTAFRFFPLLPDKELGCRLHDIDLAINKCLTLANRSEVRDIIDLLALSKEHLSLESLVFAACGKDPGFTPPLLFDFMRRHSVIRPDLLESESLAIKIDPVLLKKEWIAVLDMAEKNASKFPAEDLGCLYCDHKGDVVMHINFKDLRTYNKHYGSIRGSWPKVANN